MKSKENSTFNNFIAPILVLVVVCFVVTAALAFTYGITKPIIDENTLREANAARTELLPEAEGQFEPYDGELTVVSENKVYVKEVYTATNKSGMVVTVSTSSYGGALTAMVGIDKDGAITNVKVTEHADTPGVGTKAQSPDHLSQYSGLTELGNEAIKSDPTVNHVTGASVSSGAIHEAVWCALQQYKDMGGVK
jgi:electron transport complex protein RnfG